MLFLIGFTNKSCLTLKINILKRSSTIPAIIFFSFYLLPIAIFCQLDSTSKQVIEVNINLTDKTITSINNQYKKVEEKLQNFCLNTIVRLQKQESKLRRKFYNKDSLATGSVFITANQNYEVLLQRVKNPVGDNKGVNLNEYIPRVDSLQTMFRFLDKMAGNISGLPITKIQQIHTINNTLRNMQAQLQTATNIKQLINERKQQLNELFEKHGMGKELKKINKQVYYYQAQLNEYKSLLSDPDKLAQRTISLVKDLPAFKDFMSKNSQIAQLFSIPNGYGSIDALQGLQTRAIVQQQRSQTLAGAGGNPQQYLQQQVQQAQNELNKLKDKVNKFGGSGSDMVIPEFKPNSQKTKSFWKRLEYGLNIQSQKTNTLLPTTTDIALTTGYKLNDKSTIGIGAGYKMGWGKNISNIHLTGQGVSLRSHLDIRLKGSIWISGGYEQNYQHEFTKIDQLKYLNAWQKSGLIGLTKKYKVGKKNGNLQLLWDFLSYSQVPRTQALKFRIGYGF
ncbi:MAG: hypothetical protein Q8L07_15365 [Sediminibacterium sp.]|nr:hypothetical protein [Sediminibacterium sp.]